MKQETIVSGIRATGKLHIGNYLGALKQFIELQENGNQGFFFVADLHALTTPFEPKQLRKDTLDVVAEYIAAGLNPDTSTIFLQNQVSEHAELAWVFECITPLSELERMTQYKDKSQKVSTKNINAGLLAYPALMAADILLYKPSMVPVGDDQTQHLELTRVVARKFNNQFGKTFPEPKNYVLKPLRIMSLKDPARKMSKTNDDPLYIDDTPEEISKKLKKAVTASEGGSKSPGEENLFTLLYHFGSPKHISYFADERNNGTLKYSELKTAITEDVTAHFEDFREKKKELLAHPERLAEILGDGARRARAVASETLKEVKEKIGLL